MRQRVLQRIHVRQAHNRLPHLLCPVDLITPHLGKADLSVGHALHTSALFHSPLEFLLRSRSPEYHGVQVRQLSISLFFQNVDAGGDVEELSVQSISAAVSL